MQWTKPITKGRNMFNLNQKDTIDYDIVNITPKKAANFLGNNPDNRRIRPSHVDHLKTQMEMGRWQLSPEPIVFSKTGKLIDGQHRLTALVKADMNLKFAVATVENEEVYKVLDQGAPRTNADITGLHPSVVGPMQYLLRATGTTKPVPSDIEQYLNSPLYQNSQFIHDEIKPRDKRFKNQPFRASFIIATGANPQIFDKCVEVYKILSATKFNEFNKMMTDIFHQFDQGFEKQDGRSLNNEFFMRGLYLFNSVTNKNKRTIRVYDSFREEAVRTTHRLISEWKNAT